ncbi:hypothetical protein Adt_45509 [Abeliophyllum distichum]|uniref:Uncharacterized protein n=1 Tax=Abeliophyllum distichum TaxID=126358 RepID=A0ABD1PEN2_9LAMI
MQFQHLIDVFESSIDDVLKVVKDRVNADHMEIHQNTMMEVTSTDSQQKVHERNTNIRSRRPIMLREIMRPLGCKIVCEPDIPSFDLGIGTQQQTESCHGVVEIVSPTRNKRTTRSNSQQCNQVVVNDMGFDSPSNLLDDGLVFSEEELRSIDEYVQNIGSYSNKGKSKMITPIPFTIKDDSTLEPPMKRISRPAACIQSPYLGSFPSQGNITPSD